MAYVLGVDIGTSGTKTVLFDQNGAVIASASEEYPLYQPQNGYAEQDPADWYQATIHTIAKVMKTSGVPKEEVKGIGLSGQMHGLVMLDDQYQVIRRSIIWCDQRTAAECAEITERVGAQRLIEITANPALTGFTASKILWVRNHEPEHYAKCSLKLGSRHRNAMGAVMGGVYFTLADFAFAVAANWQGTGTVSLHSDIAYLGSAKGNQLIAEAVCIKNGRSTSYYKIEVKDELGNLTAVVNTSGYRVK